jgi:hypothetical protein
VWHWLTASQYLEIQGGEEEGPTGKEEGPMDEEEGPTDEEAPVDQFTDEPIARKWETLSVNAYLLILPLRILLQL